MISPHGGKLVQQVVSNPAQKASLTKQSKELFSITLNSEQIKDVRNIALGLYSPIKGYMVKKDFESVIDNMTLSDGTVWSIPIILDINKTDSKNIKPQDKVALRDTDTNLIAILEVQEIFEFEPEKCAKEIFKTTDTDHPGVEEMLKMNKILLGGEITLIDDSKHTISKYDLSPIETRQEFQNRKWKTITGFQTRNAPHRAHEYLQKCALEITDGLFINPVIGKKKTGDFTDEAILKSYETLISKYYPQDRVFMSILPLQMKYAGPREAVMHALIRKNFGCTHFIVGRDHAGVGDYYGTYEAQEIFDQIPDIGIEILRFDHASYCEICNNMVTSKTCPHDNKFLVKPKGTLIREKIREKKPLPEEMIRPEVLSTLQKLNKVFTK